jgi:hypothetical protein
MRVPIFISATVLLVAALSSSAAAGPAPTGPTARSAACNSVSYDGRTFALYYRGITCRSARRKVRYVHRHERLAGWRCQSGSDFETGGSCTRGRKLFGWHPFD